VTLPAGFVVARERARPLAPEERRAAILDAVIPLLKEQGRAVSTRQMAEAAGIAEGTLFRAFGDKESLIAAAIERYFDPEPFRNKLRGIDPDDSTEDKVRQFVSIFLERFQGVVGFMSTMAIEPPQPPSDEDVRKSSWYGLIDQIFRPGELAVPKETFAFFVRLVAFGNAIPAFTGPNTFTADQLSDLILRGVLPAAARTDPARTKG
jgi:AcrR family transcriptional regulator